MLWTALYNYPYEQPFKYSWKLILIINILMTVHLVIRAYLKIHKTHVYNNQTVIQRAIKLIIKIENLLL